MSSALAPRLPLRLDATFGPYGMITSYVELVKQNFKMLLLTVPGERIMNPDFGVGLKRYMFEMAGPELHAEINNRILTQTKTYMDFIQLNKIDFTSPENNPGLFPHQLNIQIHFTIIPLGTSTTIQIDFDN
jgi:phage baseplate assembly protein W